MLLAISRAAWAASVLPVPISTNPGTGDQNPYGVAVVPSGIPGDLLAPGEILVSNFNNGANLQGTGTSIIDFRPDGTRFFFFAAPKAFAGLTNALGVVRAGFVFVGSVSTTDGTFKTVKAGPLLVINANGRLVGQITNLGGVGLDGPWGLAVDDDGPTAELYVSSVLNGTVERIDLSFPAAGGFVVNKITEIAHGYFHQNDAKLLLVGPGGLAFFDEARTLYVASGGETEGGVQSGAIFSIPNANTATTSIFKGTLVYSDPVHLHGPVGLKRAPNGDLLTANSDSVNVVPTLPSEIVEFNPFTHKFVTQFSVDGANGGAFGLELAQNSDPLVPLKFSYVDDNTGTLSTLYLATFGQW
ncbi:MAG TPA: hypothetical protein VGH29_14710 [Candidatus Binataceae bacterium]